MKRSQIEILSLCFCLLIASFLGCDDRKHSNHKQHRTSAGKGQYKPPDTTNCKVVAVKDGDTYVLLISGREQTVRLAHIDCPEKKQHYGKEAKQFAIDLCFGKTVTLIHNNKYDRDRRLIAEIILPGGTNLNKELVRNGMAWHFKKYSRDTAYAQLETAARARKAGLWSEADPVAPWERRKR